MSRRSTTKDSRPACSTEAGVTLTLTLHRAIDEIDPADWNACAGDGNPFVRHAFLAALEDSGSAGPRTGWLPQHAVLRDPAGHVVAAAPMYAKSHSYGEYVFDWGWADTYRRHGRRYYPKLVAAIPFTPVNMSIASSNPLRRALGRSI